MFSGSSSAHRSHRPQLMRVGLLFVGVFLLAGCTVGPDYKRPAAAVPAKWEIVEPWREAVPKDAIPKTSWWTVFRDDDLNTLESELLAANQSLKVAFAHYDQARASAAVQNAQPLPRSRSIPPPNASASRGLAPPAPTFRSRVP